MSIEKEGFPEKDSRSDLVAEKTRLKNYFSALPSQDFKIFTNAEKRDLFRKEVESMCRHAYDMGADFIVFLDKSARGYGLLANRLLPVIRLEYAASQNIPLSNVKIPRVVFFDAQSHEKLIRAKTGQRIFYPEYDDVRRAHSGKVNEVGKRYEQKLKEVFKDFDGKKILICDESSWGAAQATRIFSNIAARKPDEQYDIFKPEEWGKFRSENQYIMHEGEIFRQENRLMTIFPNSEFDIHLGGEIVRGGTQWFAMDEEFKKYLISLGETKMSAALYGVDSNEQVSALDKEGKILIVEQEPFVKRRKLPEDEIATGKEKPRFNNPYDIQRKLREEYWLLAKESFDGVFSSVKLEN